MLGRVAAGVAEKRVVAVCGGGIGEERRVSALSILHRWGQATITQAGVGTAINVASYSQGVWHIWVLTKSGTNPAIRFSWLTAPGTATGPAAPFGVFKSIPTFSNATGMKVATLSNISAWGRPSWNLTGTSPAFGVRAFFQGRT